MKTHLVTVSSGFLGSYIVQKILDIGDKVVGIDIIENPNFKNKIEYTDNSKSVLEHFTADKSSEDPHKININSGKIVIALMDIQNQSKSFDSASFINTKSVLNDAFLNKNNIAVVPTPQGSEYLNPPEVMLIATESDASFVINGIIYDEKENIYLKICYIL